MKVDLHALKYNSPYWVAYVCSSEVIEDTFSKNFTSNNLII